MSESPPRSEGGEEGGGITGDHTEGFYYHFKPVHHPNDKERLSRDPSPDRMSVEGTPSPANEPPGASEPRQHRGLNVTMKAMHLHEAESGQPGASTGKQPREQSRREQIEEQRQRDIKNMQAEPDPVRRFVLAVLGELKYPKGLGESPGTQPLQQLEEAVFKSSGSTMNKQGKMAVGRRHVVPIPLNRLKEDMRDLLNRKLLERDDISNFQRLVEHYNGEFEHKHRKSAIDEED
ncbi:MAG: hypothetical protein Q9159_002884 [Coniocarpon cinnabarinum]